MGIYQGTGQPNFDFYQKHIANISATGVLVDETNDGVSSVRYQIVGAGAANVTLLEAQLEATAPWVLITSLTGEGTAIGNTIGYARYRIRTSVYDSSPFAITYRANQIPVPNSQIAIVDPAGESLVVNPDGSINVVAATSDTTGVNDVIVVGTTAVAARVGVSNLAERTSLSVMNNGNATIYWGFANTVTTSTGFPIFKGQTSVWAIGPNITVWLISSTTLNDVPVAEIS